MEQGSWPASYIGRIASLEERMSTMETRAGTMETTLKQVKENTDTIVSVVTHANGIAGFVKKYWPRILPIVVGIAIAKGWITSDIGNLITGG